MIDAELQVKYGVAQFKILPGFMSSVQLDETAANIVVDVGHLD